MSFLPIVQLHPDDKAVYNVYNSFVSSDEDKNEISNIRKVISDILQGNAEASDLKIDFDKCHHENTDMFIDNIVNVFSTIFYEFQRVNHSAAIPQKISSILAEYIEKIITKIPENYHDKFSDSIINLITKHPFSSSDDMLIKLLDDIIMRHPDELTNIIFTKFSAGIILPLQAAQYIQETFKEEYQKKQGNINYQAFDSFDGFHDFIKNFMEDKDEKQISFIVRHLESSHVTPIFLEKTKEKLTFFISDSLGDQSKYSFTTVNEISTLMKKINCNCYEMFVVKEQRQRDHANCLVYAIRDVKQILKKRDFFSFLKKHALIETSVLNEGKDQAITINWVCSLPFEFKKIDQSVSELSKFQDSNNQDQIKKIKDIYSWFVIAKGSKDYREKKEQNGYVIHKRNKLIQMIIRKAILSGVEAAHTIRPFSVEKTNLLLA